MNFLCDNCGPIDHVLVDGYAFGERVLEGVMFEISFDDNEEFHARPVDGWDDSYLKTLNSGYWTIAATDFAEDNDIAECPKCGADVDAQPIRK